MLKRRQRIPVAFRIFSFSSELEPERLRPKCPGPGTLAVPGDAGCQLLRPDPTRTVGEGGGGGSGGHTSTAPARHALLHLQESATISTTILYFYILKFEHGLF